MNNINFDLRQIDDFDTLEKSKQISILQTFNLNKYRFILGIIFAIAIGAQVLFRENAIIEGNTRHT